MESQTENRFIEVDLNHYLRLFRAKWWFLALVTVVLVAAGFLYIQTVEPVYRASATLLIDSAVGPAQQDLSDIRADEIRAQTYSQLITQRSVLQETIETLSLRSNIGQLRSQISVSPVLGTQLIRITVERNNPQTAAVIANTIASTFIVQYSAVQSANYTQLQDELLAQLVSLDETIQETTDAIISLQGSRDPDDIAERLNLNSILAQYRQSYATVLQSYEQTRLSEFASTSSIVISEEAIVPGSPIWPRPQLTLIIAAVGGFVIAALILLVRDYLDDSLNNAETLKNRFGLNVIGQIGHFDAKASSLVTLDHPRSPVAEAFRNIRMNLKYMTVDHKLKTLLVTSANESEGKSTMAANLAIVLARGGQNTVLIDGDLRLPKVNRLFNLSNNRGLSELFIDSDLDFAEVTQQSDVPGLSIITSGAKPPNPSELLDTNRAREIIAKLTETADVVVIDSPPLLAVTDAVALSQYVDGVVVTVRVTKTKGGMLKTALERLQRVNANLLGVLMVDIDKKAADYDDYYFSYGEYSAYLDQQTKVSTPDIPSNGKNGHYSPSPAPEGKIVTE